MSCSPDTLHEALAHRFDPETPEPESWRALRNHLVECEDCRRRALSLDPSLLFDLPRRTAPRAAAPAADPQAMMAAVAAMRRADRVESHAARHGGHGEHAAPLRRLRRRWTRYTAAAAISAAALSYGLAGHVELPKMGPLGPTPADITADRVVGAPDDARSTIPGDVPLVERTESDAQLLYEVRETDVDMAFFAVEDFDV